MMLLLYKCLIYSLLLIAPASWSATLSGENASFTFGNLGAFAPNEPTVSTLDGSTTFAFSPVNFTVAGIQKSNHRDTLRIDVKAADGFRISGVSWEQFGTYEKAKGGIARFGAGMKIKDASNGRIYNLSGRRAFRAGQSDWNLIIGKQLRKSSTTITLFLTDVMVAKGKKGRESVLSLLESSLRFSTLGSAGGPSVPLPSQPEPVPLPPAAWLMLSGIFGFFAFAKRRIAST